MFYVLHHSCFTSTINKTRKPLYVYPFVTLNSRYVSGNLDLLKIFKGGVNVHDLLTVKKCNEVQDI